MKTTLGILLAGMVLAGCNSEADEAATSLAAERDQLVHTVDSLQTALEAQAFQAGLLSQVSIYLDSIEVSRRWITMQLEEGMEESDYIARMKRINQFLEKADYTIGELEKTRSAYASQVRRLKQELVEANEQNERLQLAVSEWQLEGEQLQESLQITQMELRATQDALEASGANLESARGEIRQLTDKVMLTQAELYFAKGESMEVVGNKILFSRKRKQAAYQAALDEYLKAWELGYPLAQAKAEAMRKKLS